MQNKTLDQEIIDLSKEKWGWISERNTVTVDALFHEKSVFVHMGGARGKEQEIEIIRSGGRWIDHAVKFWEKQMN